MAIYNNRICKKCGVTFSGGPRAWYCPECRHKRALERSKAYRNNGYQRHIGDIDICKNCGKKYIIQSGLQKYCPDCQSEMHRKADVEKSLKYYDKNKNEINQKRNENRRMVERSCVICGKLFYTPNRAKCCSKDCRDKLRKSNYRMIYDKRRREKNRNSK